MEIENVISTIFFFSSFQFHLAKGRVRYEASLRLGNASIFNINEFGKKKVNLYYAALLEKYVSYLDLSHIFIRFIVVQNGEVSLNM